MNRDLDLFLNEVFRTRNVDKFPLTDIYLNKTTEEIVVELALAGFSKEDIELKKEQNLLVIEGSIEVEGEKVENIEYIQKHMAKRNFSRKIKLAPKYVGGEVSADFDKGILKITIKPAANFSTLIPIS